MIDQKSFWKEESYLESKLATLLNQPRAKLAAFRKGHLDSKSDWHLRPNKSGKPSPVWYRDTVLWYIREILGMEIRDDSGSAKIIDVPLNPRFVTVEGMRRVLVKPSNLWKRGMVIPFTANADGDLVCPRVPRTPSKY